MSIHDKSQNVRLIDVLILAPFMVWAGARESTLPGWMRVGLVGTGIATFGYNLSNFSANRRLEDEAGELEASELVKGTMHEMETTGFDFDKAKDNALAHLSADPHYYSKLEDCAL